MVCSVIRRSSGWITVRAIELPSQVYLLSAVGLYERLWPILIVLWTIFRVGRSNSMACSVRRPSSCEVMVRIRDGPS